MVRKVMITCIAAVLIIIFAAACSDNTQNNDTQNNDTQNDSMQNDNAKIQEEDLISKGTGNTAFVLEVTDSEGCISKFLINTDEQTIGAALLGVDLIDGEVSQFGLMVKTVNGERADYDTDGAYWAFYIDGEYAATGVDITEINPDSLYALIYEEAS